MVFLIDPFEEHLNTRIYGSKDNLPFFECSNPILECLLLLPVEPLEYDRIDIPLESFSALPDPHC
jgi:hypothetical protein